MLERERQGRSELSTYNHVDKDKYTSTIFLANYKSGTTSFGGLVNFAAGPHRLKVGERNPCWFIVVFVFFIQINVIFGVIFCKKNCSLFTIEQMISIGILMFVIL